MNWVPSDVIALVSIVATVVVGVAALLINHRREITLHQQSLESTRAKDYREQALEVVGLARNATWRCHELLTAHLPESRNDVETYVVGVNPVWGSTLVAQQAAERMATLGWSEPVRLAAKTLSDGLLGLGVGIKFPEMLMGSEIEEGRRLAAGEDQVWRHHLETTVEQIDEVNETIRKYEGAIRE